MLVDIVELPWIKYKQNFLNNSENIEILVNNANDFQKQIQFEE